MSEAHCPSCGHDEAIVRVRGNAFSAVCTGCGRADVTPLLDADDLLTTEGETLTAELFELDAARNGCAWPLQALDDNAGVFADHFDKALSRALSVELRLPVPPR